MSQIGRYTIVRKTGNHGLATLYEAFDPVMQRPVSIRVAERPTDPGEGSGADHVPVLFDSRQVISLEHPNIVKVLAREEDANRPYLVMEQFEGRPLSEVQAGRPPMAADKVARLLKNAASALDHVHSKGLIHQHLSSASLLIGEDEQLKLAGFEMARLQNADPMAENPAELVASVAYLSPEFLRGDALDPRSDQYSLAAVLFEALTGQTPFRSGSPLETMRGILFDAPNTAALARVPPAAARALERALAKTPAARFRSCAEFAAAFEGAAVAPLSRDASGAGAATRMTSRPPAGISPEEAALLAGASLPASGLGRLSMWLVAGAGVMVVLLLLTILLRKSPPPPTAAPVVTAPAAVPATKTTPPSAKAVPPGKAPAVANNPPARPAAAPSANPTVKKKAPEPAKIDKKEEPEPVQELPRMKPVEPAVRNN